MTRAAVPERHVKAEFARKATEAARLRVEGHTWRQTGSAARTRTARSARSSTTAASCPRRTGTPRGRSGATGATGATGARAYADVLAGRPGAVRAAVAVARRVAAMDGLDAPTSVELHSPAPEQYNAVLTRMLEIDREIRGEQRLAIEADIFSGEFLDAEVVEDDEDDAG